MLDFVSMFGGTCVPVYMRAQLLGLPVRTAGRKRGGPSWSDSSRSKLAGLRVTWL